MMRPPNIKAIKSHIIVLYYKKIYERLKQIKLIYLPPPTMKTSLGSLTCTGSENFSIASRSMDTHRARRKVELMRAPSTWRILINYWVFFTTFRSIISYANICRTIVYLTNFIVISLILETELLAYLKSNPTKRVEIWLFGGPWAKWIFCCSSTHPYCHETND